jgi:hypothetical protein
MRLMANAAICFESHDAAFASECATYLQFQTSVFVQMAEAAAPEDLLDLIDQCLASESVIVVLSPSAIPTLWPRTEWEQIFKDPESKIAYIELQPCPFPQILKRRNFFQSKESLRRWLIKVLNPDRIPPALPPGEKDESLLHLVNQAGTAQQVRRAAAEWFASNYWRDFENIYWVECGSWTRAGIIGEIAHAMNLRLPGTVDQNIAALHDHAQHERALCIFENLTEEFLELAELGGKSSILILSPEAAPPEVTLQQLKEIFFAPTPDEPLCLRLLGRFMNLEQDPGDWPTIKSIGFRARLFYQRDIRQAEAHELLVWLGNQAHRHKDRIALEQIQREENWILDSWDLPPVQRSELVKTQPIQLRLLPDSS